MKKQTFLSQAVFLLFFLALAGFLQAQTTVTFNATGAAQTFTVPAGITSLHVVAKGSAACNYNALCGYGGTVECDLAVAPGDVLNIYVGTMTGFNGGGSGDSSPGGGATDIRIGGISLTDRVVVAGGGGGYVGTGAPAGLGGGLIGGSSGSSGGGGGTQSTGGAGGTGNGVNGSNGSLGQGGAGAVYVGFFSGTSYGGGGGGGYYGGGGGAITDTGFPFPTKHSGGGGSSYTNASCTNVVHTQGNNTVAGILTLSYTPSCTTPTAYTVGGGGASCSGADVNITLDNSETGITYQLKNSGGTLVGSVVNGTGSAINLTTNVAETYTVVATNTGGGGCTAEMTGTATVSSGQAIRYVKPVASGAGDGSSWANASSDLQAMIDAACVQEVWVAAGTYIPAAYPTGCTNCSQNRDKAFALKNGVAVYGGFAGTENAISERTAGNETILSGDVDNDGIWNSGNACHIVVSASDGAGTLLDGLTLAHSYPITYGSVNIEGATFYHDYGGGLYAISPSGVTVNNVRFIENNSYGGAGAYFESGAATVTNCYFANNYGDNGSGIYDYDMSSILVDGCTFINNSGDGYGTYYYRSSSGSIKNCTFQGNTNYIAGGLYVEEYGLTVEDCDFISNTASYGGGIYCYSGATIKRCVLSQNTASVQGGGMYNGDDTSISDCLIAKNTCASSSSNGAGGGVYNYFYTLTMTNCTVANNSAPNGTGGGIVNYRGTLIAQNCILWGNTHANANLQTRQLFQTGSGSSSNIAYSDYQDGLPTGATDGGNNLSTDPLFVDAAADDFKLQFCSPVKNMGDNAVASTTDLDGNDRIYNGGTVDMGAYEVVGANTQTPVITDISIANLSGCNNNGTGVGYDDYFTADLTVTFANAPADMNLNLYLANYGFVGSVSTNDLACLTTYTFTGVEVYGMELDLVFSADFDGNYPFTSPSFGTSPAACPYPAPTYISVSPTSSCDKHNTTCTDDDSYTADVTVYYDALPATGFIELSSPDILGVAPSVAVGDAGEFEHTFTGVTFRADGQSIQISAAFTGEPPYENSYAGIAPNCNPTSYPPIFISGMQGFCADEMNGTYTYIGMINGAPAWIHQVPPSPGYTMIKWSGVRWELSWIQMATYAHVDGGSPTFLPCSGWVQDDTGNGCGDNPPNLSGACGDLSGITPSVSDISLANQSGCNNNGTSTAADDYFTADATVTFAYAPGSGDLTLKQGSTVLATKSAADLACVSEWTFTGVHIAADGADIILTAEFSPTVTFTSGSLGAAPVSCSCTPVAWYADADGDTYGNAASSVMACDQPANYVANSTDCNDTNAAVNPGATETCNGIDDDCDGLTDTADPNYTDNVNPTITCPANLSVTANSGCDATGVNLGTPVTADNCGVANVSNNHPSTTYLAGTTTVTWTVTDGKGNSATCAQTVTVTGGCCGTGADLIIQSASAPLISNKGEKIYVDGIVKNIGTVQANKQTSIRWYLSNDNVLDAGDYTDNSWKMDISKLQPNETEAFDKLVDLPNNNTYCGAKFMIFKTDADNEVTEACEINNLFVQPITISCTSAYKPDLVMEAVTAPATISAGVNFSVTYKVRNIGGKEAVTTDTKYYLSTNATYEAGDVLIDDQNTHVLEPNLFDADNKNIHVANNTAPGAYYLLFVADANNVINPEEPSTGGETNNVFALPVTVINCNADLNVQNESAPNSATAGATITVSAKVKNVGNYAAGASTLKYYLSGDNVFGNGDDVYLGSSATPPLAVNTLSGTLSASVTIPANTANGTNRIFYIADADAQICESNENNNDVRRNITISGGSLLPPPPSNDRDAIVVAQVEEADAPELTIFPNPAGKEVTFQLQGFDGKAVELTMFDLLGRVVWQQTVEEGQRQVRLDLPATLPGSGLYLVRASSGGEAVTKQLVVLE